MTNEAMRNVIWRYFIFVKIADFGDNKFVSANVTCRLEGAPGAFTGLTVSGQPIIG